MRADPGNVTRDLNFSQNNEAKSWGTALSRANASRSQASEPTVPLATLQEALLAGRTTASELRMAALAIRPGPPQTQSFSCWSKTG